MPCLVLLEICVALIRPTSRRCALQASKVLGPAAIIKAYSIASMIEGEQVNEGSRSGVKYERLWEGAFLEFCKSARGGFLTGTCCEFSGSSLCEKEC